MYGKSVVVYEGERVLGEAELRGAQDGVVLEIREIRISHYSPPSERCPPLAVLHTVNSAAGIRFKLKSTAENALSFVHANCLRDNKTAVAPVGEEEIHLVAMHSRKYEGQSHCFWGFNVASSLYNSCLAMLNLRCLGIVFDLDETLIVANTMRSFEDRIDSLQRKLNTETDPQRVSGMIAEIKRYQDDKSILKQYVESDQVIDNGNVIRSQSEVVLPLSDDHQTIVRPLIRLEDRNIILTRINPQIRDTSVLVRLRPAWEDLKSYLIARGRKRFEVFVCTMAERDYALEMWRLLDPESNLINPRDLLDRIVCVKSGYRKSLFDVFQYGNCDPKMALVIDDRLKVWDEEDQPRVHVVPPFMPFFAPQAEANNNVPVLCVARNVACKVRGDFFKEFDEGLMQLISEVAYEDDIKGLPSPPDVSNYLVSGDDPPASNGSKDLIRDDGGMADAGMEMRLKEALSASLTAPKAIMNLEPNIASALQYAVPSSSFIVPPIQGPTIPFPSQQLPQVRTLLKPPLPQPRQAESNLHSSPARAEGEVRGDLDPDTRRRLLILQHGQDIREHHPQQATVPRVHPPGWSAVEEEISWRQLNEVAPNVGHRPDKSTHHPPFIAEGPIPHGRVLERSRWPEEEIPWEDLLRLHQSRLDFHSFSGEDSSVAQLSLADNDLDLEAGQIDPGSETSTEALQGIAFKCGTKVEFKQTLVSSIELQFCVEVYFAGKKIGEGIDRTRREAQRQAAEGSLLYLADKYLSQLKPDSIGYQSLTEEEAKQVSVPSRISDPRIEANKRGISSISALKEICTMDGLGVAYQTRPYFSANGGQKNEVYAEVEINGQVFGNGVGLTWEEAKSQAAERALGALKSTTLQFPCKHRASPRFMQEMPNKRLKPEFPPALQ